MTIDPRIRAHALGYEGSDYAAERAAARITDEALIAYVREHGPVRLGKIAADHGIEVRDAAGYLTFWARRLAQQLQRLRRRGQQRPVGAVLRSDSGQRWYVEDL